MFTRLTIFFLQQKVLLESHENPSRGNHIFNFNVHQLAYLSFLSQFVDPEEMFVCDHCGKRQVLRLVFICFLRLIEMFFQDPEVLFDKTHSNSSLQDSLQKKKVSS